MEKLETKIVTILIERSCQEVEKNIDLLQRNNPDYFIVDFKQSISATGKLYITVMMNLRKQKE